MVRIFPRGGQYLGTHCDSGYVPRAGIIAHAIAWWSCWLIAVGPRRDDAQSPAVSQSAGGAPRTHQGSVAGKVIKSAENGPVDYVYEHSNQRCSATVVQRQKAWGLWCSRRLVAPMPQMIAMSQWMASQPKAAMPMMATAVGIPMLAIKPMTARSIVCSVRVSGVPVVTVILPFLSIQAAHTSVVWFDLGS
jgi:hypothetical protein